MVITSQMGTFWGQSHQRSDLVNLEMITSEVVDLAFSDEGGRLHHQGCGVYVCVCTFD